MKHILTIFFSVSFYFLNAQTIPIYTPKDEEVVKPKEPINKKPKPKPKPVYKKEIKDGYVENFKISYYEYYGIIKNGLPEGQGRLVRGNDLVYEGNFIKGKKEGIGVLYQQYYRCDTKEILYKGTFINDEFEGDGILFYCSYEDPFKSFVGRFKKGVPVYGKLKLANGDEIECSWEQHKNYFIKNEKSTCKYIFANGDIYEGDIIDFKMNGTGKYTWKDGTRFTGEFSNNIILGQGSLVFSYNTYNNRYYVTSEDRNICLYSQATKKVLISWDEYVLNKPFVKN